jgi:flagellum-specific peptidoglycan hydrolase FlgJ
MRTTLSNQTPATQIFLALSCCCIMYALFFNDWARLEFQAPVRLSSTQSIPVGITVEANADADEKPTTPAKQQPLPETDNDAAPMADLPPASAKAYIKEYAGVAVEEMRRTGIPASISMGQALVESRAGRSGLALTANNHFGIKCHIRTKCPEGHCLNFTDDSEVDYFRIFQNPYKSWKAHSELLRGDRYKRCFKQTSYQGWAKALKQCGYATDEKYAQKLIQVIETYKLYLLDSR